MDYQIVALSQAYKKLIDLKQEQINFYKIKLDQVLEELEKARASLENLLKVNKYG